MKRGQSGHFTTPPPPQVVTPLLVNEAYVITRHLTGFRDHFFVVVKDIFPVREPILMNKRYLRTSLC